MGPAPDFRVRYRLFTQEEGGRKNPPSQHIRWDFSYADKSIGRPNQVFIIWPEFISTAGEMLLTGEPMPWLGLADMFIVNPEFRAFHGQHIAVGVKGYFQEGPSRVGICEVVEVLWLHQNLKL